MKRFFCLLTILFARLPGVRRHGNNLVPLSPRALCHKPDSLPRRAATVNETRAGCGSGRYRVLGRRGSSGNDSSGSCRGAGGGFSERAVGNQAQNGGR